MVFPYFERFQVLVKLAIHDHPYLEVIRKIVTSPILLLIHVFAKLVLKILNIFFLIVHSLKDTEQHLLSQFAVSHRIRISHIWQTLEKQIHLLKKKGL